MELEDCKKKETSFIKLRSVTSQVQQYSVPDNVIIICSKKSSGEQMLKSSVLPIRLITTTGWICIYLFTTCTSLTLLTSFLSYRTKTT